MQGKIRDYEQEIEKTKKPTGTQMKSSGGGGGFSPLRASELPVPRTKIPTSLNSTASPVRRPIALSQREDNRYAYAWSHIDIHRTLRSSTYSTHPFSCIYYTVKSFCTYVLATNLMKPLLHHPA